jgi:hypothetical protein
MFPRRQVGESLTRGVRPILDSLNLGRLSLHGALSPRNSRVLWSRPQADLLTADQMQGSLLVDRSNFDTLLLRAAASAGVSVLQPATVRAAARGTRGWRMTAVADDHSWPIETAYLVDSTGRAGFLHGKREYVSPRTIAICGYLRCESGEHDILVEALPDGWCWGAPVPGGQFSAMVFLDADAIVAVRREGLSEFWRSRLARTELFASLSQWPLVSSLLVRDATSYFARDPMTSTFARVGEANYALDPLSSTGVEKAMQNGTVAAIAIHTMLQEPSRTDVCLRFYGDRQMETVAAHCAWASEFYGAVIRYANRSFWRRRSAPPKLTPPLADGGALMSHAKSETTLNSQSKVRVSDKVRMVEAACIVDHEICLRKAVTHPALSRPVVFLQGIPLQALLEMATSNPNISELLDRWARQVPRKEGNRIVQWLLRHQILEAI